MICDHQKETLYFHIDIAEVRTGERKIRRFLRNLIAARPCRIHTILSPSHGLQANHCRAVDNGIQFTNRKQDTSAFEHIFDRVCRENDIDHRLTKVNHPWTDGQVERMNRTIKEAIVKRYHCDTHAQFETHINDCIAPYNYARRLKTLQGLTPFESHLEEKSGGRSPTTLRGRGPFPFSPIQVKSKRLSFT